MNGVPTTTWSVVPWIEMLPHDRRLRGREMPRPYGGLMYHASVDMMPYIRRPGGRHEWRPYDSLECCTLDRAVTA